MKSLGRDLRSETAVRFAMNTTAVVAGAASNNAAINGTTINCHPTPLGFKAECALWEIPVEATLAGAGTVAVTGLVQDSADGTTWATLVASATLLNLTASALTGVCRLQADLNKARMHVRAVVTPVIAGTNTNTATVGCGVLTFGGLQEAP